jgi:hypothetical protein
MKYEDMLNYLGEEVTDKQDRAAVLKAVTKIFSLPGSNHSCGKEYLILTGSDTATCLLCGTDFLLLDDD